MRTLIGNEYDQIRMLLELATPYNVEYDQSRFMNQYQIGEIRYNVIYDMYSDPVIEEYAAT